MSTHKISHKEIRKAEALLMSIKSQHVFIEKYKKQQQKKKQQKKTINTILFSQTNICSYNYIILCVKCTL